MSIIIYLGKNLKKKPHSKKFLKFLLRKYDKLIVLEPEIKLYKKKEISHHIYLKGIISLLYYFKLLYLLFICKIRYKEIIVYSQYLTTYSFIGSIFSNVLITYTIGSDVLIDYKNPVFRAFIQKVIKKSKYIISVSSNIKERLIKYGCNSNKIIVLPISLSKEEIRQANKKELQISSKIDKWYHENSNEKLIISLRNYKPVYDVFTILRSFKEIIKRDLHWRLILLGEGKLLSNVKNFIRSNNLENYILITGWVTPSEKYFLLQKSDFFISASLSDGLPVSLMEAMLTNTYPILSNIKANYEIFNIYKTLKISIKSINKFYLGASYFKKKDYRKLSEILINKSKKNDFFMKRLKENKKYAEKVFNFDNNAKSIINELN